MYSISQNNTTTAKWVDKIYLMGSLVTWKRINFCYKKIREIIHTVNDGVHPKTFPFSTHHLI